MSAPRLPPELRDLAELARTLRELVEFLRENVGRAPGEERPRTRKLVGWKALLEVSVANGGPGSENRLRDLCRKRGAPVHVWRGMAAVADEQRFLVWLDGLRVPIGLEPLGASGKGRKGGRKGLARRPSEPVG